jgi:hypothetical protein
MGRPASCLFGHANAGDAREMFRRERFGQLEFCDQIC